MLLFIHILSALTSLLFSTFGLFSPSRTKLLTSYLFIASTTLTGVFLIIENNASLAHVCMSGLAYLAVVLAEVYVMRKRLHALSFVGE